MDSWQAPREPLGAAAAGTSKGDAVLLIELWAVL